MTLGREMGLDPGHTVLDGDPAPLPQRAEKWGVGPLFGERSWVPI